MRLRQSLVVPIVLAFAATGNAQKVLYEFHGDHEDALLRVALGHGDLNADGHDDIVVRGFATDGSSARAYSGRDGALLYAWKQNAGAVAHAGDVNADGFGDIVLGLSRDSTGGKFAGAVEILSGRDGLRLHFVTGVPGSGLGVSVSSAGDFNADGYDDVVAAALPHEQTDSYIQVLSGRDGTALFTRTERWDFLLDARGVGDTNGDGHADVCERWDVLEARVYSGRDSALLHAFLADGGIVSACEAGDVDADGHADVIVGQPEAVNSSGNIGNAVVYSGRTGGALHTFWGTDDPGFGGSAQTAGDLNQDGHGDVSVPNPRNDEGGVDSGSVLLFSGREGSLLTTIHGESEHDLFGTARLGGHIDGDSLPDFIIGARQEEGHPGSAGAAIVLSGARVPASWLDYGDGWPGRGGVVPRLELNGNPRLCSTADLVIANTRGAPTPAVLLVGPAPASIPTALGGTLLVLPELSFTLGLPAAGLSVPLELPCGYELADLSVYIQVLEADPDATQGVSFTRGLRVTLGY